MTMTTFTRERPTSAGIQRLVHTLSSFAESLVRRLTRLGATTNSSSNGMQRSGRGCLRRVLSVTNLLILGWLGTIWWGERLVFQNSLSTCQWHRWEQWPSDARPHHVVLVADPQLVDPHTYPGRPWPLSTLTISYTDLYLRRAYKTMQRYLQPDTLFFLGDLFDGGREWSTPKSTSPTQQYRKYGNDYWIKEYIRFESIFTSSWLDGGMGSSAEPRGRRMIASLPGNHDLGFASGIQLPVKKRFETYFGNGNRIDIIGNHSFISLDTVSLSAMDQVDPKTGSSGVGDGTSPANRDIWSPTEDFLSTVRASRGRAARAEIRALAELSEQRYHDQGLRGFSQKIISLPEAHKPVEATDDNFRSLEKSFPGVLLTHVPLYRDPNTDCGPQRERGHAIAVESGYQYQNVLTPLISKDIITKIGAEDISQVYSGDDHDYCEVDHGEFTGRIKEITVKSISLAMGVRKPGFLAVSLHNPIEIHPRASEQSGTTTAAKRDTIQNHLCLLPDTISILMHYAALFALTLTVLLVKAVIGPASPKSNAEPLLPILNDKSSIYADATTSSTSSSSSDHGLSGRAPRSSSPSVASGPGPAVAAASLGPALGGYGNIPVSSRSSSPSKTKTKTGQNLGIGIGIGMDMGTSFAPTSHGRAVGLGYDRRRRWGGNSAAAVLAQLGLGLVRVAVLPVIFYIWLLGRD